MSIRTLLLFLSYIVLNNSSLNCLGDTIYLRCMGYQEQQASGETFEFSCPREV